MSNDKQQTVVDWFIKELGEYFPWGIGGIEYLIKQAKEMEKEQIIKACDAGFDTANLFIEDMKYNSAEDYYEQTYGGKK